MTASWKLWQVWRRHLWLWVPPLVFFALNLAFFSTYRLVYAGQVEGLESQLESQEQRLGALRDEATRLSELVAVVSANQDRLSILYAERFATERQRFTQVTGEIKDLARRAGLEPSAITYPGEELADFGLVKRYFAFTVAGTYPQLRRFVNLLEVTPSFVTLEEVRLSEGEGAELRIELTLSTLFGREASAGMTMEAVSR